MRKETFMKTPVLFYGYLFFNRVGTNIKKDALESKSLLSLVQSMSKPFALERRLYNYEICLKALKTILDLVLQSGMGCLSMCGGETLIHLCLVSISLKCGYSNIFKSNSYKFLYIMF